MNREDLVLNRDEPMPPQQADWTCSACSLAWALRGLALWNDCSEADAVAAIGTPENINQQYGLMDGSGSALANVLHQYGVPAQTLWPSWQQTLQLAQNHCVLLGGASWYHWIGVRYVQPYVLTVANSAPGWMGVFDVLQEHDWNVLGPFAAVVIPLVRLYPSV